MLSFGVKITVLHFNENFMATPREDEREVPAPVNRVLDDMGSAVQQVTVAVEQAVVHSLDGLLKKDEGSQVPEAEEGAGEKLEPQEIRELSEALIEKDRKQPVVDPTSKK